MTDPWGQAFAQLTKGTSDPKRQFFQPRPAGMFCSGGATQAVHAFLAAHPGQFFTMEQLRLVTGRTDKSLDWAVRFLIGIGLAEWRSDESRNPRYRRYGYRPQVGDQA